MGHNFWALETDFEPKFSNFRAKVWDLEANLRDLEANLGIWKQIFEIWKQIFLDLGAKIVHSADKFWALKEKKLRFRIIISRFGSHILSIWKPQKKVIKDAQYL